ncbi:MAG: redoxin domain-containing protein [Bacteroidales bacterium]|nr:redoxin domain-containing protein [Bacteroidales bacterium]
MKTIPRSLFFILVIFTVAFFLSENSVHASSAVVDNGGQPPFAVVDFETFYPWLNRDDDNIYVINFWATWCAPCVRELPYFDRIHEQYSDNNVKVLLVSLDNPAHIESRVIPFLERMQIKSEVILLDDPRSSRWIPRVSAEWSGAIPATVIYSDTFRAFYEKEFSYDELEQIIVPLIK